MTDEACFDWTLPTNRRLEGLGVRERVVLRANDRLALKGAQGKSIEALDYAKKSGLVPICGRAPTRSCEFWILRWDSKSRGRRPVEARAKAIRAGPPSAADAARMTKEAICPTTSIRRSPARI